jgi:low affinity Fe/Cu permease
VPRAPSGPVAAAVATFLTVLLIQQSQIKDSVALHLKLNELLPACK